MIRLPKEVVLGFVAELNDLVKARDNAVTQEELDAIKNHNTDLEKKITERENLIKAFQNEIESLKAGLKPIPTQEPVDETKIDDLTEMLVLSGYYVKVTKQDGDYLEETGAYEEKEEQPVVEEVIIEENPEEVIIEEQPVVEEVISVEEDTNPEEVINVEEK